MSGLTLVWSATRGAQPTYWQKIMQISKLLYRTAAASFCWQRRLRLGGCASLTAASKAAHRPRPRPVRLPTELITPQLIAAQQRARESRLSRTCRGWWSRIRRLTRSTAATSWPSSCGTIPNWRGAPSVAPRRSGRAADSGRNANAAPQGFVVDHQGRMQFPFAGLLTVDGLTEEQARDAADHAPGAATSPTRT